ncbi:MAG: cobyrinate a,c-diamide synthase [Geobacter sp.]|nr:cobyrinate a,c-diamide synthase [Geobacter sp.]
MKSLIIAAPQSGSGKTTVTIGIMEVLKLRGLRVAPFKVGPDFIDPGYHRLVTGRPSINLDGWMCGPAFVRETFSLHAKDADIAVIEGVMGLFDGFGGRSEEGSTAQIAKLTGAPVVLVVNARGQARSVAAMVRGFASFDPDVRLAGVIFNNVGSDSHARILREAMEAAEPSLPVIGCIPADDRLDIPSRHLGLVTAEENRLPAHFLDHLVNVIKDSLDLGLLWSVADSPGPAAGTGPALPTATGSEPVRIGVARDEAFCFVYEDNLRLLSAAGAEIVPFSPLRDETLPADLQGLYLPGGYPELFAGQLAANLSMKEAIALAAADGMPVYAECGGFMYLTEGLVPLQGPIEATHRFVGVFPVTTRMLPRRKALGYREIELAGESIIGGPGMVARGHEFHYSEISEMPVGIERLFRVRRGSVELEMEGYRVRNCLGSYLHLHFGSCPGLAVCFVENCRNYCRQEL